MSRVHDPEQAIRKRFAVKAQDATLTENTIAVNASGLGNLDSGNDVIFPGAYSAEVLADFRRRGFVAWSHEWDEPPIAMPMLTEERGRNLYSEATFHTTPKAQEIRTLIKERLDNGFEVGISVGFFCSSDGCAWFESGQKLLDFARNNGYDLSRFDTAAIKSHMDWCRAIIKVERLVEWSPTPLQANDQAEALSAKSGTMQTISTVRELEKLLRDAGMSRSNAALSISNLKANLRDAETGEVPTGGSGEIPKQPDATIPPSETEADNRKAQQDAVVRALAARALAARYRN